MKLGVGSCLVSEAAPTQAIHSQHIALLFLAVYGSGKDPTISFPHDEDNFGPSPSSLFISCYTLSNHQLYPGPADFSTNPWCHERKGEPHDFPLLKKPLIALKRKWFHFKLYERSVIGIESSDKIQIYNRQLLNVVPPVLIMRRPGASKSRGVSTECMCCK